MDTNKETESNNTLTDAVVKPEPSGESLTGSASISPLNPSDSNEDVKYSAIKQNNGNGKNPQKRIKTESVDAVDVTSKKPRTVMSKSTNDEIENLSDVEEYYLTVSNMPDDWTFVQIKNYLDKECGHVDEMEMVKRTNNQSCAIRLTFPNPEKCNGAFQKLQNKVIQNKKLDVEMTEPLSSFPPVNNKKPPASSCNIDEEETKEILPKGQWRPDQDIWEKDPEGLYGLRPQFLKSLNITPPIDNWVLVSNFRCDKIELREVMELAGNVLMCCVVQAIHKYAKVMYSHPIEAVQAISMLNGQLYYGAPLKVTMDSNHTDILLPRGLSNVGLGLGLKGVPIRNIAHQYERYAKNKSSTINPVVFSKVNTDGNGDSGILKAEQEDVNVIQSKIDKLMALVNSNLPIEKSFRVKNVEEFEGKVSASPISGSNRSTPDINVAKANPSDSKNSSVISPNEKLQANLKPINNSIKPQPGPIAPFQASNVHSTVPIRLSNPSPRGFPRPNFIQNPQAPPLPVPAPRLPNYGTGPTNFATNQARPQFGPRPAPFMPVQGPGFAPQPRPGPFGQAPGMMQQMPQANFSGPRPFVNQTPVVPRPAMNPINPGNRVTVHFSNLPPSTTFPLLCEQLAKCGQVMSVQLTTPGCAVATFGHPSHAERCFQTYNRMNAEGYIIEVKYA